MLPSTLWHPIGAAGVLHTLLFGIVIPISALRSRRKLLAPGAMASRRRHFIATLSTLLMFGSVSLVVAGAERIDLRFDRRPAPAGVATGIVLLVAAVMLMRPRWRKAVEQRKPVVRFFMPGDRQERALWLVVAATAGISEEITWRGVQPLLFAALIPNRGVAIAICALSFGLAHLVQGWRTVALVTVFALGFHLIVAFSGTLTVAMAVHFAYDAIAGLTYGKLGRELGYAAESPPSAA